ncbi:hypothetical protein [Bacillus sp. FJAT-18017]|nr:hypothetical protein [Bacillus sp. FJAT-18017]
MQQDSIIIHTGKTNITISDSGEELDNTNLIVGKEYTITIQVTKLK